MQSFIRHRKIQETETLIKETLLQQLSYAVKEIQLVISKKDEVFSTNEECNALIVVLEAIFLHGLKRGILKSALKTVSGGEESKPTPTFWHTVSNYTHKNTIASIRKLSQVKTDVGRCRVWIRMALNEGELTSYFAAMEKDRRALNSSYSNHAFLRDRENCDTACKLLEGILTVQFQVPVNASILNTWSSEPLMLSGIWRPPIKTPLSTGVDVAERIEDDDEDDDSCSIKTSSSITTLSTILALDESQALKMILETPVKKVNQYVNLPPPPQLNQSECDLIEEEEEDGGGCDSWNLEKKENVENRELSAKRGNSISNAHGWSSTTEILGGASENTSATAESRDVEKESKTEDYGYLLEKIGISPSQKINYEVRLKQMMQKQEEKEQKDSLAGESENSNRYNSYTSKLYKIMREIGLKGQKYTCAGCQLSIGLTFGKARLCYFTGEYYCTSCHLNEISVIPSRLIFNWDQKKYPVCASVHKYLTDICSRLLIDIKKLNPKLYSAVKEMKELRELRIQLNMLRGYFYTCREPVLIELQKKVSPREYFYEFIDHYSVNDLCKVSGGVLAWELSAITSFGRNHVINCWLCRQKGFICEVCKNPEVIYPFDVSVTYRCSKCFSIYHNTCLSSSKNCPKCRRMKTRTLSQSETPNDSQL